MKRLTIVMTGLAAVLSLGALPERADAAFLGNPAALIDAADDLSSIESIHCRPYRWHHSPNRWRRADGCARRGAAVIVAPGRTRYVIRDGVRVRVGTGGSVRSRTTIDSGTSTTIRSGTTRSDSNTSTTTRSGPTGSDSGTSTTTRSGTTTGGSVQTGDRPAGGRGSDSPRQAPAQQQSPSGNPSQSR